MNDVAARPAGRPKNPLRPVWVDLERIQTLLDDPPAGWRLRAACRDLDPNLFFPGGEKRGHLLQANYARAICDDCPVRDECLAVQLAYRGQDDHGIFGGTTHHERKALRLELRRRARA